MAVWPIAPVRIKSSFADCTSCNHNRADGFGTNCGLQHSLQIMNYKFPCICQGIGLWATHSLFTSHVGVVRFPFDQALSVDMWSSAICPFAEHADRSLLGSYCCLTLKYQPPRFLQCCWSLIFSNFLQNGTYNLGSAPAVVEMRVGPHSTFSAALGCWEPGTMSVRCR